MNFSLNEVHMTLRKALCGRGLAFGVADDFGAVGARLSSGRANDGVGTVLRHDNDALIALLHRVETALSLNPTSASFVEPLEQTLAEHLGGIADHIIIVIYINGVCYRGSLEKWQIWVQW